MNVLNYAAIAEQNWKLNLPDFTDFKPDYTFYSDFSIADFYEALGKRGSVVDTFKRVLSSWGKDYKALTEIIMVLNHKSWSFAEYVDGSYLRIGRVKSNELAKLYSDLYYKALDFADKNLNEEERAYLYSTLD